MTALVMHGTFVAGNRRRIVYRVLDDSQKPVGTAVCWTASNAIYPWGLTIPAAGIINYGFECRADMMRAVEGFVAAGQIGGRHV